jgi:hypothetical protein
MTEPLSKFLGDYYKTHAASPQEQHVHQWFVYNSYWEYCACDDRKNRQTGEITLSHAHQIAALEADLKALHTENETLHAALDQARASLEVYVTMYEQASAPLMRAIRALTPPETEQQG